MILREFNNAGVERFREYLAFCRLNQDAPPPFDLLEDKSATVLTSPTVELEQKHLPFKRDVAEYLTPKLAPLPYEKKMKSVGLWSWLALFYFDSVCPKIDGYRKVYNDYRYIYEPNSSYYYYRHLLFIAWHVLNIAPIYNRLLLCSATSIQDTPVTLVLRSLYLTRIPCIFELIERLYWDETNQKPKTGRITSKTKPGNLEYRLTTRIRQLEKTYDLLSLNADQLLELLGEEFVWEKKME